MKSFLKGILISILGAQVRRLRRRNNFKIIGVVGSIGKTSTKLAISKVLSSHFKVRYQEGNYNDIVSVPLVLFGRKMPPLWNVLKWLKIIFQNEVQIFSGVDLDFVVLELGTDRPGQIAEFRKYLHLDVLFITAIAPEHMEFFGTLENVTEEEWSASFFSDKVFVNRDLCKFMPPNIDHKKNVFYGTEEGSLYKMENALPNGTGFNFDIFYEAKNIFKGKYEAVSKVELYSVLASISLAHYFTVPVEKIQPSLDKLKSFAGRMQRLDGIKNSVIIDDTYNASPYSMKMALDTLYDHPNIHKVAILGMMNELGDSSKDEHIKVGKYCDPKLLDFVVTIGKDANQFLAETARENGCTVYKSKSAEDAGSIVKNNLKENSVILAKGSQNGVFAEDALVPLLLYKEDIGKLVRQDSEWKKKKAQD